MPIYHKTPPTTGGNHNTAEIDYHTSEAAKVKRTREQAYFNSYDFDAIEVLPYDDEEDEDDERRANKRERDRRQNGGKQIMQTPQLTTQQKHHHQQQQHLQQEHLKPQKISNHSFCAGSSSSNSFMVDNHHHHQQQQQQHTPHHVNGKYNPSLYLQRITGIFATKTNKQQHHQQQRNGGVGSVTAVAGVNSNDIALGHDNKHLKLSSSETSSTSLSSSSIVEEIVNVDNVGSEGDVVVGGGGVINTGNGLGNRAVASIESTRDVISSSSTRTTSDVAATGSPVTAVTTVAATTTAGNGSNFLLPRAMLKYQSSAAAAGATGTTAANTNSMPLATNNSSSSSNNSPKQQQHINLVTARDVHKLDGIKGNSSTMMPAGGTNVGLRLKKTSTSSSVITSLASDDIEEDRDVEDRNKLKEEQQIVVTKTINPKVSARASSHQSHYSTDKSASSGYYSSNVCSTYSLEEHIYSEPTIDLKKLRNHAKESKTSNTTSAAATVTPSTATTLQTNNKLPQHQQLSSETNSVMQALDYNRRYRYAEIDKPAQRNSQEFNENLKILESSIENLDRHLKSFPGGNSAEALVGYSQNPYNPYASVNHNEKLRPSNSYHQLPTIQESFDANKKPGWPEDRSDDSLMDIDLDSFLLDKDKKLGHKSKESLSNKGLDNPTFLTDEQEENHYKCAKYINSCPEDAYRVESDIHAPARSSISGQSLAVSVDLYPKRYEEQLHFQNTRELLEDVRDKIRLLTQSQEAEKQKQQQQLTAASDQDKEEYIPKELHNMINTLKQELELYLERMNQHSELEIRQLCSGLVKNQHIVKMKNAFERRRSLSEAPDIYSTYEAIQDGIVMNAQGVPISIRQQITSIRCSSDPNFKMKRKSITEVFPMAECYVESVQTQAQPSTSTPLHETTQLQRNLSYHKPVLEQLNSQNTSTKGNTSSGSGSGGDSSEPNDKDSILDWHRKKPSIWEMYYGTNRIQQSLLGGKKNGLMVTTAIASSPSTMCYPSSRPESDFTLDLPRAEQLRIKMEKEKKFRQRCRVITTFLSLVFFLLTVMVVSLVLTRGKRMFGSMI
ncbi:homeobox protein cut [Lucilia cuprina]|uniref:homeobox protein cut n=1 Tax=Lucilia cuprina TaxID=7375 RepID=UPI001F05FA09|nr:homeobox protein cut [Lucilia cuprina]